MIIAILLAGVFLFSPEVRLYDAAGKCRLKIKGTIPIIIECIVALAESFNDD